MEELLREHLKSVYNFCFRLVGNKADAADLAQEIFIKVWKNLSKFDPEKNFKTWLFTIARNTVIDYWRKKKELILPENFELADDKPLADELFLQRETEERITTALDRLPPVYKEVVVLHALQELTFEEVSQILGRPLNTVKSQYRRALHQMKQFLRIQ